MLRKSLYFVSVYYFIVMIISSLQFLYFMAIHLLSNDPAKETSVYIYQFTWLLICILIVYCNYIIVWKGSKKSFLIINLIFTGLQLFSFHISNIYYFTSFGLYYGIFLGSRDWFEFQTVLYLFKAIATFKHVETKDYQFVAFSSLAAVAFVVYLINLINFKKIQLTDSQPIY
jgi:hypothetical protein